MKPTGETVTLRAPPEAKGPQGIGGEALGISLEMESKVA